MATKLAKPPSSTAHTAGIYADMTVDGPEIGTLVVIVDRARHLPNRKTMGKQDPYCAVRLGKDAKKTETDRRGGQTPRWDQELRFTVYDSPDYRKLKVSLFNDDKKCELIGETWIEIDELLEHGGGQNDKWHPLHYKGRHAGEIQLELTFWDLRPKAEKPEPPASRKGERAAEAVAGPRQPQKRRPLPVEPGPNGQPKRSNTEQAPGPAQSFGPRGLPSSQPQSAPPAPQQQHPRPPLPPTMEQDYMYEAPQALPPVHDRYSEPPTVVMDPVQPLPYHEHQPFGYASYPDEQAYAAPTQGSQLPHITSAHGGIELPQLPPHIPRNQRRSVPHQVQHYSPLERQAPAEYVLPQYQAVDEPMQPLPAVQSSQRRPSFNEVSLAMPPVMQPLQRQPSFNEAPPPMPPAHGGQRASMPPLEHMRPAPEPQPPVIEERRIAHSHSYQDFSDPRGNTFMPSPVDTQLSTHSAPVMENEMYEEAGPVSERDREVYGASGPPRQHLHNGHRHSMADPRDMRYENRSGAAGMLSYATPPRTNFQPQPINTADLYSEEENVHRSSVPIIRPQPRSPEYRTPVARKSINPMAAAPPVVDGLGGVAFSPDSYDVLNPNLRGQSSVNEPGPKYETPEGIREAARDRQKELELQQHGPIVDSAGRVIDPTDHLPSDTWAPEPEKKTARKAHEIRLKFRHNHPGSSTHSVASSPASSAAAYRDSPPTVGYRDSPPAPTAGYGQRPHSMQMPGNHSSPALVHGSSPSLPHPGVQEDSGRHRLQKKTTRGAYQPVASSPLHSSPTPAGRYDNYSSPASHRGSLPPGMPLREMPNYGYGSSPSGPPRGHMGMHGYGGAMSSPLAHANGAPPPIPAKVPLGRGQEDWGQPVAHVGHPIPMAAGVGMGGLEAEIRNIDIGSGRRARGGSWRDI